MALLDLLASLRIAMGEEEEPPPRERAAISRTARRAREQPA
jgi:hypothetical protein